MSENTKNLPGTVSMMYKAAVAVATISHLTYTRGIAGLPEGQLHRLNGGTTLGAFLKLWKKEQKSDEFINTATIFFILTHTMGKTFIRQIHILSKPFKTNHEYPSLQCTLTASHPNLTDSKQVRVLLSLQPVFVVFASHIWLSTGLNGSLHTLS